MNMCVFVSESKVLPGRYVLVSMEAVCMCVWFLCVFFIDVSVRLFGLLVFS